MSSEPAVTIVEKLSPEAIEAGLAALPEWNRSGEAIQRTYAFADFVASLAFVNAVGSHAEAVQHHPDILIRWNKVTLTLTTHDAGGLSHKDLEMAAACDRFAGLHANAK